MGFFKAYDMRGVFGKDFTLDTVYRVGRWLPSLLRARRFLIGRDMRLTSPAIRNVLCDGLTDAGADVDDMGLASTPMVYYFTETKHYDASVQITASHNPPDNNGMKVSMRHALPMGADSGMKELESRVLGGLLLEPAPRKGVVRSVAYLPEFLDYLRGQGAAFGNLSFAVDCSDGVAGLFAHELFGTNAVYLNDTPDGRFPHHSPNPLDPASRAQLAETVRKRKLDCGVIFDGDADRVMFVDEHGDFIQPDYLIPVIARRFLAAEPGAAVIHDIRTSRGVIEALARDGAKPVIGRVGHAFAKVLLRKSKAVCGGELAGHYYFRDFCFCDSGELAALTVLSAVAAAKKRRVPFSRLVKPIAKYATTGECNFTIESKDEALAAAVAAVKEAYGKPLSSITIDGVRLEYPHGWLNIRKSNTEPYLRLLVEADTAKRRDKLYQTIVNAFTPFLAKPC